MHLSNPCCEATTRAGSQQGKTQILHRKLSGEADVTAAATLIKAKQTMVLDFHGWCDGRSGGLSNQLSQADQTQTSDHAMFFLSGLAKALGGDCFRSKGDIMIVAPWGLDMAYGMEAAEPQDGQPELQVRSLQPTGLSEVAAIQELIVKGPFQLMYVDCWRCELEIERRFIAHFRGVLEAVGGGLHHLRQRKYLFCSSQFEMEGQLADEAV